MCEDGYITNTRQNDRRNTGADELPARGSDVEMHSLGGKFALLATGTLV
ncbi:hypothetical protein AB1K83_00700 [Sporosarcina sp. 179-K 3D1 HS]